MAQGIGDVLRLSSLTLRFWIETIVAAEADGFWIVTARKLLLFREC